MPPGPRQDDPCGQAWPGRASGAGLCGRAGGAVPAWGGQAVFWGLAGAASARSPRATCAVA